PALVLDAELAPTVDAGLSEDDGPQAVDTGVVPHVLIGGPLAAAVGGVEVERLRLGDAAGTLAEPVPAVALLHAHVLEAAVDLVGRGVEQGGGGRVAAGRLEQVEGAERVDLEVVPRLGDGGGHGHLRCEVEDDLRVPVAGQGGVERGPVPDVDPLEGEATLTAEPLEVAVRAAAGEVVQDDHLVTALHPPSCRIAADEARSARHQIFHASRALRSWSAA